MLKKILIALVVIVALVFGGGLLLPKEFSMEREIVIEKPKAEVFNYLKLIKNQTVWSPWEKMDPEAKHEFKGTDGKVGFIASWDGNDDIGQGEQEIKNIVSGERIDMEIRFTRPMEGVSQAYFITEAVDKKSTKVKWGFSSKSEYPKNIMCALMNMSGFMEKTFDQGLVDLKTALEKK